MADVLDFLLTMNYSSTVVSTLSGRQRQKLHPHELTSIPYMVGNTGFSMAVDLPSVTACHKRKPEWMLYHNGAEIHLE